MPHLLLMLSRGCTRNTARLIPLLVSIVLCCSLLLYLSCSQLQRGSTRMNQTPKALCPPVSHNFHSSLSLSVYLLHSPSMSMSLFPVSSFQQCFTSEPHPTQQIPLRGTSPFYPAHSLSRTPGRYCLTPLVFICHFLINATSVFHSESVTPPNTHVAVTSSGGSCCSQGHRSKVLVGRPIISATVSGTPA